MTDAAAPRWPLRLAHYARAVDLLDEAVALRAVRDLSDLEKAGLIQPFGVAWDLGWKLMADFLVAEGTPPDITTSASVIRTAFAAGVVADGDGWMAASRLRHQLTHTYDVSIRDDGLAAIADRHLATLVTLRDAMVARRDAA